MNTDLGLNFLRIVNEAGDNGWSQIYAKVPFDDVELRSKGALFGAVFGENASDWVDKEVEMMAWIDEYINEVDLGGNLGDFFEQWRKKYDDLSGIWVWVLLGEGGRREVKIVKWGESGVFLKKKNVIVDLTKEVKEGGVIRGVVNEGDVLCLWTGVLGKRFLETGAGLDEEKKSVEFREILLDENLAASGLILKIDKIISVETKEVEKTEKVVPLVESLIPVNEIETPKTENKNQILEELVSNKYVGPIGLKERVFNWWGSIVSSRKDGLRIERVTSKRKKWSVLLGVVFLVLLLISLVVGSLKLKNEAEIKRWKSFYEPIERSRLEAVSLVKLNPVGAKKLMEEVRSSFEVRKIEFLKGKYGDEVSVLEKKINNSWIVVSGETETEIEEMVRIDLIRPGFLGDRMTRSVEGKLMVVDKTMGLVVAAEVKTKDVRVLAGKEDSQEWVDITGDGKRNLVMTKKGIMNADKKGEVVSFDAAVLDPIVMGTFMGNIYVLDRQNKEIFKYALVGDAYGDRSRWLKQGQLMGVSPVDMAIDSDVWVVSEIGQIEKYRRGAREQFLVSGLPSDMKVKGMAVEVNGGRIALLNSNSGSVVICSKDVGTCSQQLKSEKLKAARDVEFGESGELYVLLPGVIGKIK